MKSNPPVRRTGRQSYSGPAAAACRPPYKSSATYVVTHVERRIRADANALTTMANPLTRRAWNCLAPFTEIYVHISLHDIIKTG